jgi:glycosyltransferase involved in cell wall biosynthesis
MRLDLHVFFAHMATPQEQARAGFGTAFEWDVDLTTGYAHSFLQNLAPISGTDHFMGCDTPEIGVHLRKERFDALLVMGWHLKCYLQAIVAAKRIGIPTLVRGDSHLGTPRSSFKQALKSLAYPWLLRQFDAALYVGSRSLSYYNHYGYPPQRLFFSPHCVDTEWFSRRATPEARVALRRAVGVADDTMLALFSGRLVPFKRIADLVEAVAVCRRRGLDAEVLVAGDGELRSAISSLAADLDVPLHLLGFCNQSQMPAVYAASDVLVLPSDGCETWGLVANEALACGRPVIISRACGCAPDLADSAGAGRVFPTGDISSLAEVIASMRRAPPSRTSIEALSCSHSLDAAVRGVIDALSYVSEFGTVDGAGGTIC